LSVVASPFPTVLVWGENRTWSGSRKRISYTRKWDWALTVVLPQRDATLPNVPTLKEEGIDVYTWGSIKGLAAPAGTPKEVVSYLEGTVKKICEDPEFKTTMDTLFQPVIYQGSEDFAKFIQQATADYAKLIKDLNIKLE
jgi:tripartite-type tricarboxylate transporter receptor subunit TctC